MTADAQRDPPGQPTAYYFRDVLLIDGKATRLYIVRHAQSEENRGEHDDAEGDAPLSKVGREQAKRLGQRFVWQKVDAVYSSPMLRAQQTARAIADSAGGTIRTLDDLREVNMGDVQDNPDSYSGEAMQALRERFTRQPTWDAFPGSEGSAAARSRIVGAMDRVIEECGGKRVAVVTHGMVIMTYVSHVLGLERDMVFYPFNAGITSIRAQAERRVIWRLNDVAHLDGMPPGFGGIS